MLTFLERDTLNAIHSLEFMDRIQVVYFHKASVFHFLLPIPLARRAAATACAAV
jgi:hypothetical protein